MPSSGLGNSFNTDYTRCQRYFYYKHRRGIERKRDATLQPALVIGTCVHEALAQYLVGQALEYGPDECLQGMRNTWQLALERECDGVGYDPYSATDDDFDARCQVAEAVMEAWAVQQWERGNDETTLAVEWDAVGWLPNHDYILPHLYQMTFRADHVVRLSDGTVCIRDWKTTRAPSPQTEARNYLMTDQHLGYAWAWQRAHPEDQVYTVEYAFLRLHPKVSSKDAFHIERRDVFPEQLEDWYERMAALRGDMSGKWDDAAVAWQQNRIAHGPCMMYGRACEYAPLCQRPWDREQQIREHYQEREE